MAQNERTSGLTAASEERSARARRRVEETLAAMRAAGDSITFKTVAEAAAVSRQYLYQNFKDQIDQLRVVTRRLVVEVDGERIGIRSSGRAATIELALRNKITRLTQEVADTRKENAILKRKHEKALGEAEEWRTRHKQAVSELLELRSKLSR